MRQFKLRFRAIGSWTTLYVMPWILTSVGFTQQTSMTQGPLDGLTPPALTPGVPAGSYALSGLDNVNLYNGVMNFRLPLLKVGGTRGEPAYTMTLMIQKIWHIEQITTCEAGSCNQVGYTGVNGPWNNLFDPYGPGRLDYRYSAGTYDPNYCSGTGTLPALARTTLTRLTFTGPDLTEYELRDDLRAGLPNFSPHEDPCQPVLSYQGISRGTTFSSHDGSVLRFISDATVFDTLNPAAVMNILNPPTGNLLFPDGSLYRIVCGQVSYIRDRNGNQTTFRYENNWTYNSGTCTNTGGYQGRVTQIVDPLGRQVIITYGEWPGLIGSDVISFTGFNGQWRSITVQWADLSTVLRSGFTSTDIQKVFPELSAKSNGGPVVSSVQLPNNQQYQFQYNPYGELARVVLPTGGAFEYDWGGAYPSSLVTSSSGALIDFGRGLYNIYRRLLTRRVYPTGTGTPALTENYSASSVSGGSTPSPGEGVFSYQGSTTVTLQHLDSSGTQLAAETHYFSGDPSVLTGEIAWRQFVPWTEGLEIQTDSSGLRSEYKTLAQGGTTAWWSTSCAGTVDQLGYPCTGATMPTENSHTVQVDTELLDTPTAQGPIFSRQTLSYDQYNNVTDTVDYDYTSVPQTGPISAAAPGPTLRQTHTDYQWSANSQYISASTYFFPKLPAKEAISLSGTTYSSTTYEYDAYQSDSRHAPLQLRSGIVQMDTSYSSGSVTLRGNVTGVTRGLGTDATTTSREFDVGGSLVGITDGNGNSTTYDYAANYYSSPNPPVLPTNYQTPPAGNTFALFTKITNALGQFTPIAWDLDIGKPTTVTDLNNHDTKADYTDPLDRLKSVTYPDGGTTAYDYNDPANTVTTTTALSSPSNPCAGPSNFQTDLIYDGLGRKATTHILTDPQGAIRTDTTYDALGRAYQVSNPYRTGPPVYTTTTYDALGRVLSTQRQDNSVVSYQYAGAQSTTNEWGCNVFPSNTCVQNATVNTTDALGHLKSVQEANGNQTGYSYDSLGNLTDVNQSGQTRHFVYDSLSRLKTATNPENASTSYTYDSNGNVLTVVQGGTTRCFGTFDASNNCVSGYDALNRPTVKSYLDYTGAGVAPTTTAAVHYSYDQAGVANSIGHLTQISNGSSITKFLAFDSIGRVTNTSQTTGAVASAAFLYVYDLAGNLEKLTYPSGRTVTTCYDGANRVASVSGQASAATTYATGPNQNTIQYTPHGAVSQLTLGSGLFEQTNFDSRLQPTNITLGTSLGANNVWGISNTYVAGASYNNGNLLSQVITMPGVPPIGQTFLYDAVNRLKVATEKPTSPTSPVCPDSGSQWCELFSYDSFGNRSLTQSSFVGIQAPVNFSAGSNRITDSGWGYDQAGNLNQDAVAILSYKYDAENRIVAACANEGPATCTNQAGLGRTLYSYDGDGRRVTKQTPDGILTTYIYDASGALAAEYGGIVTANGTEYLTADQLGSTRVVTDASGRVIARHDFAPFGDEIGTNARPSGIGYGTDASVRQKFTGKERDAETGLDYFGARHFSAAQGRFTSPDWSEKPQPVPYADLKDPQTLNLYSYGRNNPLSKADPDGHDALWVVDKKAGTIKLVIPVNFTGSGATPRTVAQIVQRDQSLFTPGSGVTIQVIPTKTAVNGVLNHMDISPGNDLTNFPLSGEGVRSANGVDNRGGNEAHINSSYRNAVGAAAHDVLHFAGMEDKYVGSSLDSKSNRVSEPLPGYRSNIMADRSGTDLKVSQFEEANKNRTTKHCEVVDGKTTCK